MCGVRIVVMCSGRRSGEEQAERQTRLGVGAETVSGVYRGACGTKWVVAVPASCLKERGLWLTDVSLVDFVPHVSVTHGGHSPGERGQPVTSGEIETFMEKSSKIGKVRKCDVDCVVSSVEMHWLTLLGYNSPGKTESWESPGIFLWNPGNPVMLVMCMWTYWLEMIYWYFYQ